MCSAVDSVLAGAERIGSVEAYANLYGLVKATSLYAALTLRLSLRIYMLQWLHREHVDLFGTSTLPQSWQYHSEYYTPDLTVFFLYLQ
jgi:hypothetical protein